MIFRSKPISARSRTFCMTWTGWIIKPLFLLFEVVETRRYAIPPRTRTPISGQVGGPVFEDAMTGWYDCRFSYFFRTIRLERGCPNLCGTAGACCAAFMEILRAGRQRSASSIRTVITGFERERILFIFLRDAILGIPEPYVQQGRLQTTSERS
jgi:hypothetical protein